MHLHYLVKYTDQKYLLLIGVFFSMQFCNYSCKIQPYDNKYDSELRFAVIEISSILHLEGFGNVLADLRESILELSKSI